MPIDFLSPGQLASYGRYGEPPSAAQLERFFHFDERDRTLIARRRGDHNRLGFVILRPQVSVHDVHDLG